MRVSRGRHGILADVSGGERLAVRVAGCAVALQLFVVACGSSGDSGANPGADAGFDSAGAGGSGTGGTGGSAGSGAGGRSGAGAGGSAGASGTGGGAGADGGAGASGSAGGGGTAGVSGASGAAGTAGAAGAGGSCFDPGPEPNNNQPLASPACGTTPCDVTDCDSTGSLYFGGPLDPALGTLSPGDVDWFHFHGKDTVGICQVDVTADTPDSGFRLCAFVACDVSTTQNVTCTTGTPATSPIGQKGCCIDAPGTLEVAHDCGSSATDDDSATVYLRVDQATMCTDYLVDYHF